MRKKIDEFFLLEKNKSFPAFDGLRAIAITMVMMAHIQPWLLGMKSMIGSPVRKEDFLISILSYLPFIGMNTGTIGVDIFFVLSGFLIVMTLFKKQPNFLYFIFRRYARLIPVHLVLIIGFLEKLTLIAIFLNIFFLVDLFPSFSNVNLVTWTLSYEMIFYVMCAAWMSNISKVKFLATWKFLFLFIFLFILSQPLFTYLFSTVGMKFLDLSRFVAFFFGVVLAKLYYMDKALWGKLQPFFHYGLKLGIPLILLFQYVLFYFATENSNIFFRMISWLSLDFGIFLFIGSLLLPDSNVIKRFLELKLLRIMGILSYSMYLFHYNFGLPIAKSLIKDVQFVPLRMGLFIVLSFVVTCLFSIFLFHFLEKPYFKKQS